MALNTQARSDRKADLCTCAILNWPHVSRGVQQVAHGATGHTSWTTSGLAYLSLFLAGKLRCFDGGGHPWKAIVSIIPTGVAVWIGITRLQVRQGQNPLHGAAMPCCQYMLKVHVPCCAVPHCAMPRCAVSCCAVLICVVLRSAMLGSIVVCAVLFCEIQSY